MIRKPERDRWCHQFCYLQLFWWEGSGSACQESLTWAKLLREICSLFLPVLFHPLPTCLGNRGLCGQNLYSLLFAEPLQVRVQWAEAPAWFLLVGFRMLVRDYFQGKVLLVCLGRQLIVLIAAWSSLAPWPVPESRCVMSPFLNRWTCHMPLRVLIQHSLTMWVNRFKASPGKKKKGVSSLGRWVIQWKISQAPPLVSWWWKPVCPSRLCLSGVLSPCSWLHEVSSPTRSPRITLRHIQIWAKLLIFVFCLSMNLIYSNGWTGLWVAWCLRWRWCEMGVERKGCGQNLHR